jgi:uncharacterized membrane protein YfcA
MSWPEMAIVSVTVLIGATLQGSVGFGMGLLASPILILIDERFVPAPILLSTWVLTTFLTLRERHAIDLHGLRWALVGRVVGTFLAGSVLVVLPADRMAVVFGGLVLVGVLMTASGLRFQPRPRTLATAGMLSAIMGTIASIGGPPMALVYQDAEGARLRATMSSFFWIGTILSLVALRLVGRFGSEEVRLTLVMLPGTLIGLYTSRWTASVVDRGNTRTAVLAVAAVAGVVVILRQLF